MIDRLELAVLLTAAAIFVGSLVWLVSVDADSSGQRTRVTVTSVTGRPATPPPVPQAPAQ